MYEEMATYSRNNPSFVVAHQDEMRPSVVKKGVNPYLFDLESFQQTCLIPVSEPKKDLFHRL